ncbi:hypothetical protein E4U13_001832 [Claviceps humidiphila]|uniref:Methyltransferase type 11 domain-containing protein n=1 Tax=Claviceps humidiphila TaxID=1294629 RepID=A0A9P7Q1Y9_9HYPO|nr:hypothetical protein E4U13_001832 [Claviceps humidiphila]
MESTTPAKPDCSNKVFAKDENFWLNYLEGRPTAPKSFFERIYRYHEEHRGQFDRVHDVGAGNGPYAKELRLKFSHVIVSDIATENVTLAQERLGEDGFQYRVSRLEDADDIPPGSVDMVFATNVLHFCDQDVAMRAVARQLRPGGTFACASFGSAYFSDEKVQEIYTRIGRAGARLLLKTLDDPERLLRAMDRTEGTYNVAPLDEKLFMPGAQRVDLNMPEGGMLSPLPPEMEVTERDESHVRPNDVLIQEEEDGWRFSMDIGQIKAHIESFPFGKDVATQLSPLWREMEDAVQERRIDGHWPAKVILATRAEANVE